VLPFADLAGADSSPAWWQDDKVLEWGRMALVGLVSLLLLLLVVRPTIRALTRRPDEDAEKPALAAPQSVAPVLTGDDLQLLAREAASSGPGLPKVFSELNPLSEIRLPAPGSGLEHQIEHLQMLALQEPERVSEVIKHWVGRNEKKA
jgi:flagellar M-ring protein FliF